MHPLFQLLNTIQSLSSSLPINKCFPKRIPGLTLQMLEADKNQIKVFSIGKPQ